MNKPVSKVREAKLELYRKKGKIHAREVRGRFNTPALGHGVAHPDHLLRGLLARLGRPAAARPAVRHPHEKFYLFGLVLWPQDALLLAIALILAATGLFLVTALAGRLFCGFACPQTVTSIFMWIEEKVEGDHLARLRSTRPPTPASWRCAAPSTACGWPRGVDGDHLRRLLHADPRAAAGRGGWKRPVGGFWLIFYGLFTYVQAGFAREAVCQHMCPYSRFQGVMFDPPPAP
jgi:polyferredoxin